MGLAFVRTLGDTFDYLEDDEELENAINWSGIHEVVYMKTPREVIEWIESDCIGGGEEEMARLVINGITVYENKVSAWMYDNGDDYKDDGDVYDAAEEEFGEELMEDWCNCEFDKYWNLDALNKLMNI